MTNGLGRPGGEGRLASTMGRRSSVTASPGPIPLDGARHTDPACNPFPRCVALLSERDMADGLDGGLGAIEMLACAFGFRILDRYRDEGAHDGPIAGSGVAGVIAGAKRRAFDAVIVSGPCSLGMDRREAIGTLEALGGFGVDVYAALIGRMRIEDVPSEGWPQHP